MPFIELQSIDSTNNYARRLISEGLAQHKTAIFTHEQFAGRGQRERRWLSEKDDGIILSILSRPPGLRVDQQFDLGICAAVSALQFFRSYAGESCSIKWPNDLYWQDRKAGGILIENILRGAGPDSSWDWCITGIGINLNQETFDHSLKNPVSLRQITGRTFQPLPLAKELFKTWEKNFDTLCDNGSAALHREFVANLYKRGETVKFRKGNIVFEAVVMGITREGKLVLQHSIPEEFSLNEIEWLG